MPLCETKKQSSVPREVTVHYCIQYTLASNFRAVVVNVWIPRSYITASNNQQHIKRCHIHIFFAQAVALSPCLCTQYGFVGTSEWGDQNRFKRCKHAQRHSIPCSWDLWSLTGAQGHLFISPAMKGIVPSGSGEEGEVTALLAGPVNYSGNQ